MFPFELNKSKIVKTNLIANVDDPIIKANKF